MGRKRKRNPWTLEKCDAELEEMENAWLRCANQKADLERRVADLLQRSSRASRNPGPPMRLWERHTGKLTAAAKSIARQYGLEADDLLADTYIEVAASAGKRRGPFLAWARGVMRNVARKTVDRRPPTTAQFEHEPAEVLLRHSPLDVMEGDENVERIRQSLARRPMYVADRWEGDYTLLLMRGMGWGYEDMERATGLPAGQLKRRVMTIRKLLRKDLADLRPRSERARRAGDPTKGIRNRRNPAVLSVRPNPAILSVLNPSHGVDAAELERAVSRYRTFHGVDPVRATIRGRPGKRKRQVLIVLGNLVDIVYEPKRGSRRRIHWVHSFGRDARLAVDPTGRHLFILTRPGARQVDFSRGIVS